MKKIDRLRYIEKNFGLEFVLRYFLCKTWGEIEKAIHYFENKGLGWGMRTDTFSGNSQKFMCPFLFKGNKVILMMPVRYGKRMAEGFTISSAKIFWKFFATALPNYLMKNTSLLSLMTENRILRRGRCTRTRKTYGILR